MKRTQFYLLLNTFPLLLLIYGIILLTNNPSDGFQDLAGAIIIAWSIIGTITASILGLIVPKKWYVALITSLVAQAIVITITLVPIWLNAL